MDIYSAGEQPIEGVSAELILNSMCKNKCRAEKFKDIESFAVR